MFKKQNIEKFIFIIYCFILVWVVLFKTAFSFDEILFLKSQRSLNLIPFDFIFNANKFHIRETLLNLFAFIPFGLYLRMINASVKHTILYGIGLSLIFELAQFVFAIGICDVTDLITNTFGTFLGICLYFILLKIFSNKQKAHKVINWITVIVLLLFFTLFLLLFIANIE